MKPIAYRISDWLPCKEVIYRCPKCATSFEILGDKERHCHICGQKIDWNVIKYLKEPKPTDQDEELRLINIINAENQFQ
ncbi:hypothetical protein M2146_002517 [Lachnospiraceae bacterium PF1-22]